MASVMPAGGVHLAAEENPCELTSILLAAVVVTLGVPCVTEMGVL